MKFQLSKCTTCNTVRTLRPLAYATKATTTTAPSKQHCQPPPTDMTLWTGWSCAVGPSGALWVGQPHPWLLPTEGQEYLSTRAWQQKCPQTLPNAPRGKTAMLRTTALKSEAKDYNLLFALKPIPKCLRIICSFRFSLGTQSKNKFFSASPQFQTWTRGQILPQELELCTILERSPEWMPTELPEPKICQFLPYLDSDFLEELILSLQQSHEVENLLEKKVYNHIHHQKSC